MLSDTERQIAARCEGQAADVSTALRKRERLNESFAPFCVGCRWGKTLMSRLNVALCLLVIGLPLLSGCGGGPDYRDVKSTISAVPSDKARLVFFRLNSFGGGAATLRVQINDATAGYVPNGSLLRIDRAPGDIHIAIKRTGVLGALDSGQAEMNARVEAGQEYYFQVGPSNSCDFSTFGYGGCGVMLAVTNSMDETTQCGAGWCIASRPKEDAIPKLDNLTVETPEP